MKLNSDEDHRINSSENLEIWVMNTDEANKNDRIKSLSDTLSILLDVILEKFRFYATYSLLIGCGVPANAALPSGIMSASSNALLNFSTSLENIS